MTFWELLDRHWPSTLIFGTIWVACATTAIADLMGMLIRARREK